MQRASRLVTPVLVVLCLALLVTAAWLFLLNPTVPRPQVGPDAGCSAAYDTVLNGADNVPGGEAGADSQDVAKACRQAGKDVFAGAVGLVAAAVVLAAWAARRALRRSVTETSGVVSVVRVGVYPALLAGALLLGLAVHLAVGTALEDEADLRTGDVLLGWFGYVVAVVLAGVGAAALLATVLGPRLQRRGEVTAARWVLAVPTAAAAAVLCAAALLL